MKTVLILMGLLFTSSTFSGIMDKEVLGSKPMLQGTVVSIFKDRKLETCKTKGITVVHITEKDSFVLLCGVQGAIGDDLTIRFPLACGQGI